MQSSFGASRSSICCPASVMSAHTPPSTLIFRTVPVIFWVTASSSAEPARLSTLRTRRLNPNPGRAHDVPVLENQALEAHLREIGWEVQRHDARTLRSRHETAEGEVTIYVRLNDNWLIASVVPFLSTSGNNSFELARWLLRVNRDMYQHKFAYDEDGDVVLTVELPTESIDTGEIRGALKELLTHAVAHRRTLRLAAGGPPPTSGGSGLS